MEQIERSLDNIVEYQELLEHYNASLEEMEQKVATLHRLIAKYEYRLEVEKEKFERAKYNFIQQRGYSLNFEDYIKRNRDE